MMLHGTNPLEALGLGNQENIIEVNLGNRIISLCPSTSNMMAYTSTDSLSRASSTKSIRSKSNIDRQNFNSTFELALQSSLKTVATSKLSV